MSVDSCPLPLASAALQANLRETAGPVVINPNYAPLQDIVSRYQGLSTKLEGLLYEISHPYRNWKLIIPELRAFVLKNLNHYRDHQQGPESFSLFMGIFFDALKDSTRNDQLLQRIMEAMLAYADKLIHSLDAPALFRFEQAFAQFFSRLHHLDVTDPQVMMSMVQGHHPVRKMALQLIALRQQQPERPFDFQALALLMRTILLRNYGYWLGEEDPLPWFERQCGDYCRQWHGQALLAAISHQRIRECLHTLESVDFSGDHRAGLEVIVTLPNHMDIVRLYKDIPVKMIADPACEPGANFVENRKLLFLFRIMETRGLSLIHEETLREINRSLVQLIRKQTFEEIEQFFITTFHLLKANVRRYPHTSLQCIQVIGNEVFKRGNSRLVEAFLWEAVRFGFQYANVRGVDEDWQPIANPAHLTNLRVWLNLIQQEPKWCSTLFSALIINLRLSGTCVRDTDLFQRDITDLLNHPIVPIYNLAKQFTKLMPVFFNEIGAEGELRDVSTDLDELHKRADPLIHFLRKQAHVESSNLIVGFIEAIFTFWITLDPVYLREYLPDEVLHQVQTSGPFVDDLGSRIRWAK
jgi:pyruvate,orthophosphate dikinase